MLLSLLTVLSSIQSASGRLVWEDLQIEKYIWPWVFFWIWLSNATMRGLSAWSRLYFSMSRRHSYKLTHFVALYSSQRMMPSRRWVVGDHQVRCLFLLAGNLVEIRILFGLSLMMSLSEIRSSWWMFVKDEIGKSIPVSNDDYVGEAAEDWVLL